MVQCDTLKYRPLKAALTCKTLFSLPSSIIVLSRSKALENKMHKIMILLLALYETIIIPISFRGEKMECKGLR